MQTNTNYMACKNLWIILCWNDIFYMAVKMNMFFFFLHLLIGPYKNFCIFFFLRNKMLYIDYIKSGGIYSLMFLNMIFFFFWNLHFIVSVKRGHIWGKKWFFLFLFSWVKSNKYVFPLEHKNINFPRGFLKSI